MTKKAVNWYLIVPIIFFIAIIPLIVRMKLIPLEGITYDLWMGGKTNTDVFSYYKSVFIIACATISALVFMVCLYLRTIKIKNLALYFPLLLLSVLIIASTAFSEFQGVAVYGSPDRYEGELVLLSYIIMCFIIMNAVNSEKEYKLIFSSLLISAGIISLIGLLQFSGWNIFHSSWGQNFILAGYDLERTADVYSTLYNSNNVGSYMAMLVPLTLVFYFFSPKGWQRILFGMLCTLMFATLLACDSRAGFLGALTALIIALVFLRKIIRIEWRSALAILISFTLVFAVINYIGSGRSVYSIKSIFSDQKAADDLGEWHFMVDNEPLKFERNRVIINHKIPLKIAPASFGQFRFYDNHNQEVFFKNQAAQLASADCRFQDYKVTQTDNMLKITVADNNLYFKNIDHKILPVDEAGRPITIYHNIQGHYKDIKIVINENNLLITPADAPLIIRADQQGLVFMDPAGKVLPLLKGNKVNWGYIDDPRYDKYKVYFRNNRLIVQHDLTQLDFLCAKSFFLPLSGVTPAVKTMQFSDYNLILSADSEALQVVNDCKQLIFKDGNNRILACDKYSLGDDDYFVINDARFLDYRISTKNDLLRIKKGEKNLVIFISPTGYKYLTANGKEWLMKPVETFGFAGRESIGSGRGYIWSRTIPLLKDTIILGHGPDTFSIYFPQHEIEGKFNYLNTTTMIVDKPHSLYLQMGVNTGVISLLAFLACLIMYLYSGLRKYPLVVDWQKEELCGLAVWLAVIAYLAAAVFNDSLVSVAPVFWGLLGLGIALVSIDQPKETGSGKID